eukprot:scaffold57781_cov28-Tisochrysis_lutea.AAC.4
MILPLVRIAALNSSLSRAGPSSCRAVVVESGSARPMGPGVEGRLGCHAGANHRSPAVSGAPPESSAPPYLVELWMADHWDPPF